MFPNFSLPLEGPPRIFFYSRSSPRLGRAAGAPANEKPPRLTESRREEDNRAFQVSLSHPGRFTSPLLCGAPARGCKPKIYSKLESDIIIIILNYFYLILFFLLVIAGQLLQKLQTTPPELLCSA